LYLLVFFPNPPHIRKKILLSPLICGMMVWYVAKYPLFRSSKAVFDPKNQSEEEKAK